MDFLAVGLGNKPTYGQSSVCFKFSQINRRTATHTLSRVPGAIRGIALTMQLWLSG